MQFTFAGINYSYTLLNIYRETTTEISTNINTIRVSYNKNSLSTKHLRFCLIRTIRNECISRLYHRVDSVIEFIAGNHREKKIGTHKFGLKFYRGDNEGKQSHS